MNINLITESPILTHLKEELFFDISLSFHMVKVLVLIYLFTLFYLVLVVSLDNIFKIFLTYISHHLNGETDWLCPWFTVSEVLRVEDGSHPHPSATLNLSCCLLGRWSEWTVTGPGEFKALSLCFVVNEVLIVRKTPSSILCRNK